MQQFPSKGYTILSALGTPDIYFLSIIDILQEYNLKKKVESSYKTKVLRRDPYEANNTYTDDPAIHDAILKVADEAYTVQANLPSPPFSPPVSDYVHGDLQVLFQANHNTLVPWGCPVYH